MERSEQLAMDMPLPERIDDIDRVLAVLERQRRRGVWLSAAAVARRSGVQYNRAEIILKIDLCLVRRVVRSRRKAGARGTFEFRVEETK